MSSPNISFADIPSSIRKPGVYSEFNLSAAKMALPANDEKCLIIAQRVKEPGDWAATTSYSVGDVVKPTTANGHYYVCIVAGTSDSSEPTWPTTASGTVTDDGVTWLEYMASGSLVDALTPTTVYSDDEAASYFGQGSHAHLMAAAALAANPELDLTICAVDDDGSAVKATGTIEVTGTASGAGTLYVWIGNVRISVSISNTDTASTIATALHDAIVAKKHHLPVTSSVSTGTVTLHAKNGGTLGNYIPLAYTCDRDELTVTITDMASGATDPDLGASSGALDTVYSGDYTIYMVGLADSDNLGDLKTHLDNITGATEQRRAVGVFGYTDEIGAIAAVKTLCGTTLNHWRLSCAYLPGTRSLPYEVGAAYGAVVAGESDPAMPLNDLPLAGIHPPAVTSRLTRSQIEDVLDDGVTPLHVTSGERVAIVRAITTYITNAQGVADTTRLDITVPRALDYVRLSCRGRISVRFPRTKKTTRVKNAIRSELLDVLDQLESLEIVENMATWADYLIVEDDSQDANRVNARIPADIVQGLHVIAERIDLL